MDSEVVKEAGELCTYNLASRVKSQEATQNRFTLRRISGLSSTSLQLTLKTPFMVRPHTTPPSIMLGPLTPV